MKKAFTLAEIMIVLTIIGVMSAILMPVAFQAAPDEGVLKFKKAYNTLGTVIRELTTSEKYYKNGDLGTPKAGTLNTQTFCNSIAEILSTKEVNCGTNGNKGTSNNGAYVIHKSTANKKDTLDDICLSTTTPASSGSSAPIVINQIVTVDGIYWWEAGNIKFDSVVFYNPNSEDPCNDATYCENGFDATYKVFCIDVDGPEQTSLTGKKTGVEAPFGFGIRRDGKILMGARAEEYVLKNVQKGE